MTITAPTPSPVQASAHGRTIAYDQDGITVNAKGLAKAAMGTGELRLTYAEIPCYWHKPPTKLVTGVLLIGTPHGKIDIRYRLGQAAGFDQVVAALASAGVPLDQDAVKSMRLIDLKRQARADRRAELREESRELAEGFKEMRRENREQSAEMREEVRKSWDEVRQVGRDFSAAVSAARDDSTFQSEQQAATAELTGAEREAELAALRAFHGISAIAALNETGVSLEPGERLYLHIDGGVLVQIKEGRGHFEAGNAGVRVRVAKGVSVNLGKTKGRYVPGAEGLTVIDTGDVYITDRRVLFTGPKQSREWRLNKLTGMQHSSDGNWTALPVSNRQTTSGVGYGPAAAEMFRTRLGLVMADLHGAREEFVESLR